MEGAGVEVLYLVRHGKAVGSHPDGDRHRPLSAEGRLRITSMAPLAAAHGFAADLALSSPYLRAVQTRDLFSGAGAGRSETLRVFTPEADPADAFDELVAWEAGGFRRIVVFTHNPLVTDLAELLVVPSAVPGLVFHTPTILAVAFDGGLGRRRGRPLWVLHP